jgi:hypothetical protein
MTIGQNNVALEKWTAPRRAAQLSQLYELMSRCVKRYTGGDSTSVPKDAAKALLDGLSFVLGEPAPDADLALQYEKGLELLEQKTDRAKALWREACLMAPDIENLALHDTLKEIGGFFSRYDPLFAHEIPCMIDYPLSQPIPDALLGVDAITEYLLRLKTELDFLDSFPMGSVRRLLECCCMDLKEQLVNLYEPVAINALGLAMLNESPMALNISDRHRQRIMEVLANHPWDDVFQCAAGQVLDALNLHSERQRQYLANCIQSLFPRLRAAMAERDLSLIFLSNQAPLHLSGLYKPAGSKPAPLELEREGDI